MMFETDSEFEDECRRIARLLWPAAEFGGAAIVDQRERDGVFESEEFVHCIECTTSKSKRKAEEDCQKLDKLLRKLRVKHPDKFLRGWFITLSEPTADQRAVTDRYRPQLVACSFEQFRARLVDGRSYIDARRRYAFGSVRDPRTGSTQYDLKFVEVELLGEDGVSYNSHTLSDQLAGGRTVVLTGDYGAGKSSTAREVFLDLSKRFWRGDSPRFPVLLNLRDHHGQVDPVESLERHARNIGFGNPTSLVRAWRAGFCILILDGFDEVASAGWAGSIKRLRDLRFRSMELLRKFVRESVVNTGTLITGRQHFFDSETELRESLDLGEHVTRIRLSELSAEEVKEVMSVFGWSGGIPEWLPTRPLLLSYLASSGLVEGIAEDERTATPAAGWNTLLDRISRREAEIEAGLDPGTVRRLIERIATRARSTLDGLGPIAPDQITACFRELCGYPPDDRGAVLLQRLPGLGGTSSEDGSRAFVDRDLAEVARAGDVFAYVKSPYDFKVSCEGWQSCLRELGAQIVALRCEKEKIVPGRVRAALVHAIEHSDEHILAADVLLALVELGGPVDSPVFLKGVAADEIAFSTEVPLSAVEFQDSVFGRAEFRGISESDLPLFRKCLFGHIDGVSKYEHLPQARFVDCTIGEFETAAQTTDALMQLSLPIGSKVLLTILKKLFAQSGRGRQEAALYRGLDHKAQRCVPEVLEILRRAGFVVRSRQGTVTTWLPAKTPGVRKRALEILTEPIASNDPILQDSRALV